MKINESGLKGIILLQASAIIYLGWDVIFCGRNELETKHWFEGILFLVAFLAIFIFLFWGLSCIAKGLQQAIAKADEEEAGKQLMKEIEEKYGIRKTEGKNGDRRTQ